MPRIRVFGCGPSVMLGRGSARAVGSIPRLQAQVAEISKSLDNGDSIRLPITQMPAREAVSTVHPVAVAMPQGDEFWRKVPLWENVSSADFLSYRWSVSLASFHIPAIPTMD